VSTVIMIFPKVSTDIKNTYLLVWTLNHTLAESGQSMNVVDRLVIVL